MKNLQNKESGKAQIALLVVLALGAGSAGVWSELRAAAVTTKPATQIDVAGGSDTENVSGSVSENGDGTANVSVSETKFMVIPSPGITILEILSMLSAGDPASTTFTQTASIQPGMSGKQTGSGTASATVPGMIMDMSSTFTMTPVMVSLQMTVANTDQVSAFDNHTLNVDPDPVTGKVKASRVVASGVAALGMTAGSISLSIDGEVYSSATGAIGQVQLFSNHSVTRIQ